MIDTLRSLWFFFTLPYLCMKHGIPKGSGIAAALGQLAYIGGIVIGVLLHVVLLGLIGLVVHFAFG